MQGPSPWVELMGDAAVWVGLIRQGKITQRPISSPLCCSVLTLSMHIGKCVDAHSYGLSVSVYEARVCVNARCLQVPEDEDDTCELELPSPLDMAEMVSGPRA